MRLAFCACVTAVFMMSGCGEVDVEKAGRNAALAALEASNPEIAQGLRAAQTLREAAATCGWRDVDAAGLAKAAVAGIEEAPVRAAASSLIEDLLVAPASTAAPATATSDCSPEARRALEAQIAAIAQGGGEAEGG